MNQREVREALVAMLAEAEWLDCRIRTDIAELPPVEADGALWRRWTPSGIKRFEIVVRG